MRMSNARARGVECAARERPEQRGRLEAGGTKWKAGLKPGTYKGAMWREK